MEPNLYSLLNACFASKETRDDIARRINSFKNIDRNVALSERITFSIIRLILKHHKRGSVCIDMVFDLANTDWRDLLMAAEHGEDINAHKTWARRIVKEAPKVVIEEPQEKCIDVNHDGWTQCPSCGFKFKITDSNAWDGKRHRRCSQPLKIEVDHRQTK